MAPRKGTKRGKCQALKEASRKIRKEIDEITIDEYAIQTTKQATSPFPSETTQNPEDVAALKKYDAIEEEELAATAKEHKAKIANSTYFTQNLPVRINVAVPEQGRFTREVETTIGEIRNIELVTDIVKNSLPFEIKRAGIDVSKAKFAGIMTYGPTNDFSKDLIHHTRGLFVDDHTYKKWWLGVNRVARVDGDHLKIAVILEDGSMLKKSEWDISEGDMETGCRNYAKMQEQVRDARGATAVPDVHEKADKAKLEAELKALSKEVGILRDFNKTLMQEVRRLKAELADAGEEYGESDEDDDSDYVEDS